jgi:hypothetical protein
MRQKQRFLQAFSLPAPGRRPVANRLRQQLPNDSVGLVHPQRQRER